jgi:signal transduction histidine kinase
MAFPMDSARPVASEFKSSSQNPIDIRPSASPEVDDIPINILLVDDEPRNLTVLESILTDPGYRLVRAESPNQALLSLVQEEFALIVLDIQMPGMSGFELAQMVKQRKKTAGVPIIFLTAYYSESQHVLEGYDSGAVDYLHKPVNPLILRSKVAVFAALHRTKRATERTNAALLTEVSHRRRVEEQLLKLNLELEDRVEQRMSELKDAHRRKDEFLATLAHELRNPLAPIRNALQILKTNPFMAETTHQIAEVMDRQVHHLVRLIDDLLDVSRVMGGKIELRKEPVELASAVSSAVETVQSQIDSKGHKLEVCLPSDSLLVDADPIRLTQIIGNLLTNATKYTEAIGHIRVAGERVGNKVILRVRDSGIGIESDMLAHIFELFVQVDQTATRSQGGLGIGLTLVKNLVEMHEGDVTANSAGLGKGSEFVVRLPLATRETIPQKVDGGPRSSSALTGLRLLVVDDNKDAAITLAMLLRLRGHEVRIAHNGAKALEIATDYKPEVIFLDIGMPGMDGYDVARNMRSRPGLENVFLVALTGWGQQSDRLRATEAGFDRHLTKPADPIAIEGMLADFKGQESA